MSFENIIGNNKVKTLLSNSIQANNVLHSYLFVGSDGIGKFLFAKEFANMILCNSEDFLTKPCKHCTSCIQFSSDNHPDFMVIDLEDGKNIKIEQIRYLQEKIAEKPIVSSKKVYIINNSDFMTKEAQNCLLKTLEEPPEYAIIILVLSNENKLLNTIISRCTKIFFQALSNSEILEYFSNNNINNTFNSNILKLCSGSIGKAIELQSSAIHYDNIDSIISSLDKNNIIDLWGQSDILYQSKDNISNLLEYMNIIFMDKLIDNYNIRYINCVKIIEQTKKRLSSNANYDMCIDNLLLKMWEEFNEEYSWS